MSERYDGPAQMRVGDTDFAVRVRLTGHVDPIDGHYHWRGMVFGWAPPATVRMPQSVAVSVGAQTAEAQLTEITPWGTPCIVGVGAPPYSLDCGD